MNKTKEVKGSGNLEDVKFEVLIVVLLKMWDVLLCCWVNSYWCLCNCSVFIFTFKKSASTLLGSLSLCTS